MSWSRGRCISGESTTLAHPPPLAGAAPPCSSPARGEESAPGRSSRNPRSRGIQRPRRPRRPHARVRAFGLFPAALQRVRASRSGRGSSRDRSCADQGSPRPLSGRQSDDRSERDRPNSAAKVSADRDRRDRRVDADSELAYKCCNLGDRDCPSAFYAHQGRWRRAGAHWRRRRECVLRSFSAALQRSARRAGRRDSSGALAIAGYLSAPFRAAGRENLMSVAPGEGRARQP